MNELTFVSIGIFPSFQRYQRSRLGSGGKSGAEGRTYQQQESTLQARRGPTSVQQLHHDARDRPVESTLDLMLMRGQ